MPRAIADLTLSFGLVSIPVRLYPATQTKSDIHFNLLHKTCGSRLRQQYVCIKEDVVVERSDMVKGYEVADDQYVVFKPEELKALEEKGTHSVDIVAFIPLTRGRSDLLRQGLLPGSRQAWWQAVRAALRRDAERPAAARSRAGPGAASPTPSWCVSRPRAAWCCSSCCTAMRCVRCPSSASSPRPSRHPNLIWLCN